MGRKRNQGRARKAAKAKAKQEAEERRNNNQTATNEAEEQLTAAQIQRMQQAGNEKCKHGFDPFSSGEISSQFVPAFHRSYEEAWYPEIADSLIAAQNATMEKYADVWNDPAKLEMAISFFLFHGTDFIILNGDDDDDNAKTAAIYARYCEQYIAVVLKKSQPLFRWNKILETQEADLHSLVTFFRKRIPCSCLDEKYKEVKNISKMGMCFNPNCSLPNRMTKRSETMYCDGCLCVTYCSRACQKSDWYRHKPSCENCAAQIAEFETNNHNVQCSTTS